MVQNVYDHTMHAESTSSYLITEVKQRRAGLVPAGMGDRLGMPCVVDFF